MRFLVLLFATASSVLCADATLWGPVESGLQLGIDAASTVEPALRILLKNMGSEPRDLLIGYRAPVDLYNLEITTSAPSASEQPVLDLNALQAPPPSLLLPMTAHLQPGEVRVFRYPLSQLICIVNRTDVPFRTLLEQGYSVRATFEFPGVTLATPDLIYMW
ncbi:MAG: hypothetical protein ABSG13_14865 [Bryobacteraceae bacterium]